MKYTLDSVRSKFLFMVWVTGIFLVTAPAIFADGYSPLNLPDRGAGPTPAVQGEQVDAAQDSDGDAANDAEEELTLTGNIVEVNDELLVMEINGMERQVEIPNDVEVVRDGQQISLNEIQPGDTATIERNEDGDIVEVRVASKQTMDFWRGFLPIFLVVLIGFYLLTRKKDPKSA